MSKKAEKQFKELRRLMPWVWDARVEEHPPGEKSLHDFENVVKFDLEGSRTRPQKPPPPGKPTAAKPPKAVAAAEARARKEARLSPPADHPPPTDNDSNQGMRPTATADREPPPSTARHPGTTLASTHRDHTTTPAPFKSSATPKSLPSSSRGTDNSSGRAAALADGQFQPTPGPTPASVVGTKSQAGGVQQQQHQQQRGDSSDDKPAASAVTFRSPAPRTVFAKKRQQVAEAQGGTQDGVIKRARTPAAATVEMEVQESDAHTEQAIEQHAPTLAFPSGAKPTVNRAAASRPASRKAAAIVCHVDDEEEEEEERCVAPKRTAPARNRAPASHTHNLLPGSELAIARPKDGPEPPSRPPRCPPLFRTQQTGGRKTARPAPLPQENLPLVANGPSPAFFVQERGLLNLVQGGVLAKAPLSALPVTVSLPAASVAEGTQLVVGPPPQQGGMAMGSALMAACQMLNRQRQV